MRELKREECQVIMKLAEEFESAEERSQLLADLSNCTVTATVPDGSILSFDIVDYQRPPGHGRGLYRSKDGSEVEGVVNDADDAELDVLLLADSNHRVCELELVKYLPGSIIRPMWNTFRTKHRISDGHGKKS